MNKLIIIFGVIIAVGVGWYLWSTGIFTQPSGSEEETVTQEESIMEERVTVTLSEQNNSGESGVATIIESVGGVLVVLDLIGAPDGIAQPAHVHFESCANIGGVKYPLTSPVNGYSETTLDISMADIQAGLPLSINVHKSDQEASVYVACGNIVM